MSDLVVVPTPLRKARAERRLCDAQGGLLLGPRVATFSHLVPGLLAAAGDRRTLLSPLAERILALEVARESGLLGVASTQGGAGRAAARLLAELRAGEVSPGDLRGAAASASHRDGERLAATSVALALLTERLEGLDALDAAGAMRVAAAVARRGARSEETRDLGLLVLEGMLPTSPAAIDLGVALAGQARRVLARVPFLPDDPAVSAPVVPWLRRLESLHELSRTRDVEVRFPSAAVQPSRRALLMPAPDDRGQCDAAARLAASLLEEGMAPGEVAVIAPRALLELLPESFARLGVPLAVPLTRPLGTLPVVRDLRAALGAAGGLDRTSLLALLGSPYLGPEEVPSGLAGLLDRAGVLDGRGDPVARLRARAALLSGAGRAGGDRPALLRVARVARALSSSLAPFRSPATPSGWAARVRTWIERSGVRRRAQHGDAGIVRRDLAAVARLEELLDEVASALAMAGRGTAELTSGEWIPFLDLALDRAELPAGRGPADGAVDAWPLDEAPGLASRAVIVLGAGRGSWPGSIRPDPLLGNPAREHLDAHLGRRALSTAFHQQSEAELRGTWALHSGSELVAVGWTREDRAEGPAPLAVRALHLAGATEVALAADPPLAEARGEAEALRGAARLAGEGRGAQALAALSAISPLHERAADAASRGAIERERRVAWIEGSAAPFAGRLPPDLPAWLESLPDQWSPSDLETHAGCPFRYLLKRAGVREGATGGLDMEPRDEGALLHAVLEVLVRERSARGAWPPVDGEADREDARRLAGAVLARFEGEGRVGDPATWAARRENLLRTLDRFIAAEAEGDPRLRPALLEFEFGGQSGRPPLSIPAGGEEILLQGRIDRVDADAERLVVVDYKSSRSASGVRERLDEDALGRTSFQAPVYLMAAARELPGRSSLAATFSLPRSGERVSPWTVEPGDPFLALDEERRAGIRAAGGRTLADGVAAAVARIRSGALPVVSQDCTGCPFGAVCRFPRQGEA